MRNNKYESGRSMVEMLGTLAQFLPPITVEGKEYYISQTNLSWWDSESACKAIGKTMVQLNDLVNETDENYVGMGTYCFTPTTVTQQLLTKMNNLEVVWNKIWIEKSTKHYDANMVETNRSCSHSAVSNNSSTNAFAVCK